MSPVTSNPEHVRVLARSARLSAKLNIGGKRGSSASDTGALCESAPQHAHRDTCDRGCVQGGTRGDEKTPSDSDTCAGAM